MIERFKGNIEINHNSEEKEEKNRKRHEAIREHVEQETTISKPKFFKHLERSEQDQEKVQDIKEKIQNIDFSRANPRNNSFMNELAFIGGSVTEGFLDVFNIEVNKSVDKYKNQLQIIEQRNEEKEHSNNRFFIGSFRNDKLKRFTPYRDKKEELQPYLDKQNKLEKKQEKEISKSRRLNREQEKEEK